MRRFFIVGWVVVGGVLAGCSHDTAMPTSGAPAMSLGTIAPKPTPEPKAASMVSVDDPMARENYPGLQTADPRLEAPTALDKLTVTSVQITGYNVKYDHQLKALRLVERRFASRENYTRRQILWTAPGRLGRAITHIEGAPVASLGEEWEKALWDGPNPVRITVQLLDGTSEVLPAYTNESTGQTASREMSSDDPIWRRAMENRE